MLKLFIVAAAVGLSIVSASADGLSAGEKDEVRALIRDHLLENPEILADAFEALQAKQRAADEEAVKGALADLGETLRNAGDDPVGGNPDGTITVVEFFDYNCPYCRKVKPEVVELLENDERIRYVFKEFPILSASSAQAARAALGVWASAPDKYWDVHQALMGHEGTLTEAQIQAAIEGAGLDWSEIVARGDADDITAKIRETMQVAGRLNINGTPSFVIGNEVIPGFVDAKQLEAAVAASGE
ncbi:DsbA family protein [Acuticoccus yangtzensis]|uniref:DsbA family protein n=1 Tax=Acuticoccus yangtzensis TaxID=1443441 RepID=UPI0009495003|nr:DsbA family protein [Acuticoccus yangtzensis]